MDSKGNDALLKTTHVTEWTVQWGGWISVAFGGLMLLGCALAYVVAVLRGNVDPVLPLISDAAGSPPQNGLFGTLLCLSGMCGVTFMIQRYLIILEVNKGQSSLVTCTNKLALLLGIISMLGITLVTGYPVNFYRNRDVWMQDVAMPHLIGGVLLLGLGLLYIALQCILTLFVKGKGLSLRLLLLFVCTAAFVYHMITVPDNFRGISHLYKANVSYGGINYTGILPFPPTMGVDLKLPIDTGGSYVASAISEWVFVIAFCFFFFTFYKEGQEYSLVVVIETHSKHGEAEDATKQQDFKKMSLAYPNGRNGSQADIVKPPPEQRKVLRRDSTCQTMGTTVDKIITPTPRKSVTKDFSVGTNGTSEADAKLNKLLDQVEKQDVPETKTEEVVKKKTETEESASACPLSVQ